MRRFIFFIFLTLCGLRVLAQSAGDTSIAKIDTTTAPPIVQHAVHKKHHIPDSLRLQNRTFYDSSFHQLREHFFRDTIFATSTSLLTDSFEFSQHPYFRFTDPIRYSVTRRQWSGKEGMFYSVVALLIVFALIRNAFRRYISDLFSIFFRTSLRQRQIKEQMLQSPFPSLLMNLFFLLSMGLFLALLLQYYGLGTEYSYWALFGYCALGLIAIYGVKFLTLKVFGWIFQISDVTDAYIFVVFSTNKVIGIVLLPYLVILSFSNGFVNQAAMNLGIATVAALLAYRYFLAYVSIHRQVRISLFHFVLYFCAFEIAPLLLINKLLFRFLMETP